MFFKFVNDINFFVVYYYILQKFYIYIYISIIDIKEFKSSQKIHKKINESLEKFKRSIYNINIRNICSGLNFKKGVDYYVKQI